MAIAQSDQSRCPLPPLVWHISPFSSQVGLVDKVGVVVVVAAVVVVVLVVVVIVVVVVVVVVVVAAVVVVVLVVVVLAGMSMCTNKCQTHDICGRVNSHK